MAIPLYPRPHLISPQSLLSSSLVHYKNRRPPCATALIISPKNKKSSDSDSTSFSLLKSALFTCMAAANSQSRGLASLGKRFLGQIRSRDSVASAFAPLSVRSVHDSNYAKNQEEHAEPAVVPDHVIPPQPEEYWAPHPETGVFGPASDDKSGSGGVSEGSALHQTAFFRSLEDLDKPPVDLHKQEQA